MNSAIIQARIFKGYGKAAAILGECYAFYHSVRVNRLLCEDGTPILTELGAEIHLPTSRYVLDENGNRVFGEDGRPLLAEDPPSYILGEDGQKILAEDGTGIEAEQGDPPGKSPLANAPYANLFVSLNAEDMKYGEPNKYGKATWYALFDAKNAVIGDYLVGDEGIFFIAAMQLLLPILVVECNQVATVYRPQVQSGVGAVKYSGTTTENQTAIMIGWPCSILQGTKGEKNEAALPGDVRSPWWTILLPKADDIQILPNDIITDDLGIRYVLSSVELSDLGWRLTAMTAVALMIAIADVRTALVNAIQAALYPNGTAKPSISGTDIKIFAGWPASADLNADLAAGKTDISVFPKPEGRNTTRYPEDTKVLVDAAPTLTLTTGTVDYILAEDGGRLLGEDGAPIEGEQVNSQVVTVGGTVSVPQNIGMLVNRRPYSYAVQPNDTLAYIAGCLAALIGEDVADTSVSGTSITVGPTGRIQALRVGASATVGTEVRRQERVVMITVWASTPALRDQIGAALDTALAQIQFLDLPYDYGARLIYKNDNQTDVTQKQTLYRWDFNYLVEYPTVVIAEAARVLFPVTNLSTPTTPTATFYI